MKKTRREFLKLIGKGSIVLGSIALAPSTAVAKLIQKPAPVNMVVHQTVPEDYVLAPSWEPYEPPKTCKDMDEFHKNFRTWIHPPKKTIEVYQTHYIYPVKIKCTPIQVHRSMSELLDRGQWMDLDTPTYALTENIIHFADGWGWGHEGWEHVYDTEDFMRHVMKDKYDPWRKPQDILFGNRVQITLDTLQ